jgi:ferredoxin
MKLKVDNDLCSGHARCWTISRKFFALDGDGYSAMRGQGLLDVPAEFEEAARKAEAKCPEKAIQLIE